MRCRVVKWIAEFWKHLYRISMIWIWIVDMWRLQFSQNNELVKLIQLFIYTNGRMISLSDPSMACIIVCTYLIYPYGHHFC